MSTKSAARTVNAMILSTLLVMAHVLISHVALFAFVVVALLSLWLFLELHVIASSGAGVCPDAMVANDQLEDIEGFDNAMLELQAIEGELYALQDQYSTDTWMEMTGGTPEFLPKP